MITFGEDRFVPDLKKMWRLCFPDDTDDFVDFYFRDVYKGEETLILLGEGSPVASLQVIPYRLRIDGDICRAGYISGAMTHPEFRRRGYMEVLLKRSFEMMKGWKYDYTFLIPQEQWLFDFYGKYGYFSAFPTGEEILSVPLDEEIPAPEDTGNIRVIGDVYEARKSNFFSVYSQFLSQKGRVVLKDEDQTESLLRDLFLSEGVLFCNDSGFAFALEEEQKVVVKEFSLSDPGMRGIFLNKIANYFRNGNLLIRDYAVPGPTRSGGMIKNLSENRELPANIYMSMMLD